VTRRTRLAVQLDACTRLLARACSEVVDAETVLAARLADLDGYPSGGGVRGSSPSTTVEGAMMRREHLHDAHEMMARHVAFVDEHLGQLLAEAGAILGRPTSSTTDRCSGGAGLPGALEWGRPDCEENAAVYVRADGGWSVREDGLCDACRMRRYRWRKGREQVA